MKLVQRILGAACVLAALFFAGIAVATVLAPLPAKLPTWSRPLAFLVPCAPAFVIGRIGVIAMLALGRETDGLLAPRTFVGIGLAFLALSLLIGVPIYRRLPGYGGTIPLFVLLLVAVASIVTGTLRLYSQRDAA